AFALAVLAGALGRVLILVLVLVAAAVLTAVLAAILTAILVPLLLRLTLGRLLGGEEGGGLGAGFVLEIDVEALADLFALGDVLERPLGLKGAQHAEIVLGVLQVVFRQHPVA